jgi:hypothetical protein
VTKKVLISGMTAAQSSRRFNNSNLSFAGALSTVIEDGKTLVDWATPTCVWTKKDVSEYDAIILGVAPVLSLTANKAYPILSLIDTLRSDPRLTLFIDAPEPGKIHASLRAVARSEDTLFKDLYSKRKDYQAASGNAKIRSKTLRAVEFLMNEQWPNTIYPKLPWDAGQLSAPGVPSNISGSTHGVGVDYVYAKNIGVPSGARADSWVEDQTKTKWIADVKKQLMYPSVAMKMHRTWGDSDVVANIGRSIGALIGPHNDKVVWWSPRFMQSLGSMTPVVTEWRSSAMLGDAWTHLATVVEQMSAVDRYELAMTQQLQYVDKILDKSDSVEEVYRKIGM